MLLGSTISDHLDAFGFNFGCTGCLWGCILEVLGSSGARGFNEFQIGGPGCCLAAPFLIILMPLGSILDALDAFGGQFWRSGDHLGLLLKAFVATWCHLGYSGDPGSAKMSSRAGGSAVLL